MCADLSLEQTIIAHQNLNLSVNDLVNTFLMYCAAFTEEPTYAQYELCKPALAWLYDENQIAFTIVAKRLKECFKVSLSAIIADMESLRAGSGTGTPAVGTRDSQADLLAGLTQQNTELFHDDLSAPYAAIQRNGHQEILPCRGSEFRSYLRSLFYQQHGKVVSTGALYAALGVLEGLAVFGGQRHALHTRLAYHEGAIWYDLSDPQWRAVRVSESGWSVVARPPILFRRFSHQAPQVVPERGGSLDLLNAYLPLSDAARDLMKVTLCSYFIPDIPHAGLHPHGGDGAGKSFLLRVICQLVDPSHEPLLSLPHDRSELARRLSHHYCAFFDNVSTIAPEISNMLCRAVTGEGFSKRALFSDDEDVIYAYRRCLGFTGINVAATNPDLLARLVLIEMHKIAKDKRKKEKTLWATFERDRPYILGAICDVLVRAMQIEPTLSLPDLPRMADFATWGEAIFRGLGREAGKFLKIYQDNIEGKSWEIVHGHPVAAAIVGLMRGLDTWNGTATELLPVLGSVAERLDLNTKDRLWPKAPNALSHRVREVASTLGEVGVVVSFSKDEQNRTLIGLEKGREPSPESPRSPDRNNFNGLGAGDKPGILQPTSNDPQ
jgi:hypothetical protein